MCDVVIPMSEGDTVVVMRVDHPVWSGLLGKVGTVTDFYERGTRVCVSFDDTWQQYVFPAEDVKIF